MFCHLFHVPIPFCFSNFSNRLDYYLSSYISHVVGMTVTHHHTPSFSLVEMWSHEHFAQANLYSTNICHLSSKNYRFELTTPSKLGFLLTFFPLGGLKCDASISTSHISEIKNVHHPARPELLKDRL
jgi:hypothetical protein